MNYLKIIKYIDYKVYIHPHPLTYIGVRNNERWLCDGKSFQGECLSGINDFNNKIEGIERFRCEKCDFDLCKNCMDYYYNNKKGCIIF